MTAAAFRALARKDLRELLPVLVAMAALVVIYLADAFIVDAVDARACEALGWLGAEPESSTPWIVIIVGFVLCNTLLAGEHQQGTIHFLQGLPVTRRALFAGKLAVAAAVLLAFALLDVVMSTAICGLHHDSLVRRQLDWRLIGLRLGLDSAMQLIGLGYGVLLAYFRRLGWVLLLVSLLGLRAGAALLPALEILDPSAMTKVEHFGKVPLVPWRAWFLHAVLGLGALLLAARLWLTRADQLSAWHQRPVLGPRWRRAGLVLGAAVGLLMLVGVVIDRSDPDDEDGDGDGDGDAKTATATIETRQFHFTYRRADEPRARMVAAMADATHDSVRRFLGAPAGGRVIADLTDRSNEHAGIAGWQRMRLDLDRRHSDAFVAHVLRHEVAHVVAGQLLGEVPDQRAGALRFFSEGLADYVAHAVAPSDLSEEQRRHSRLLAAHWRSRFQIQFEALQDPSSFAERHPEAALYAFGELWTASLVQSCGPSILGRTLRRFGDASFSRTLRGSAVWRAVLAREGCELEGVRSRYEAELRRLAPEAARLPVASAVFQGRARGQMTFLVEVRGAQGRQLPIMLLVRDGPHTPPAQIAGRSFSVTAGQPSTITVTGVHLEGDRFEYMVGARPSPTGHPIWSRWQSTSIKGN
jgi:hypothetical protein